MKKCPLCHSVFTGDVAFCLQDGTTLLIVEEEKTVVMQSSAYPHQPLTQGVSPIFAYLTIGLAALFIGGGAVFAFVMWGSNPPDAQTKNSNAGQTPESPKTNSVSNQNTPIPIPSLTTESVQNLMNSWEKSQDTRNFSLYKSCYDLSFKGIKRTVSGSASDYNYNQWLNDRQKMMNKTKYMDVRLDKLRISIQNETATVEFDQYFSVTGYADFGPKIIKVKMTENGAKIFYEELKSSTLVTD